MNKHGRFRLFSAAAVAFALTATVGGSVAAFGGMHPLFQVSGALTAGQLAGRVIDMHSGRPIGNASVSLQLVAGKLDNESRVKALERGVEAARAARNGVAGTRPDFGQIVGTTVQGKGPEETKDLPGRQLGDSRAANVPSTGSLAKNVSLPPIAEVSTAADGTFVFTDLPSGEYRVIAKAKHYLAQEYGQQAFGENGKAIAVLAGKRIEDVSIRLEKSGVISGSVIDENGMPKAKVNVQAFVRAQASGGESWMLVPIGGKGLTDDLGRYRIEDLDPGYYYIRAVDGANSLAGTARIEGGEGVRAANAAVPLSRRSGYVPGFFPNTADPSEAQPVRVPPGGVVGAIDFSIRPTLSGSLRGTVVFRSEGDTALPPAAVPKVNGIALLRSDSGQYAEPEAPVVLRGPDRPFQITNLVPGRYRVIASGGDKTRPFAAMQNIDIESGTESSVTVTLRPLITVSGRLSFEGSVPLDFKSDSLRIALRLVDDQVNTDVIRSYSTAQVKADGSFSIPDVVSGGRYLVALGTGVGAKHRVRVFAAHYGAAEDVFGAPFGVVNENSRLEIRASFGQGDVEGIVTNQNGPKPGTRVLLAPVGRRVGYSTAISDGNGKIGLFGILPGNYLLFAWDKSQEVEWFDPRFMASLDGKGVPVRVENGGKTSVMLPILESEWRF